MKELTQLSLSEAERNMFLKVGRVAADIGQDAYVVGGFVRDRLLNRNQNRQEQDVDIVTVGDGPALARALPRNCPMSRKWLFSNALERL